MGFENFHSCNLPGFAEGMTNGVIWKCDECKKKYEAEIDVHWSHVSWREIINSQDLEESVLADSDFNKFGELYKNLGVEVYVGDTGSGYYLKVITGHHNGKVNGHNYNSSTLLFDNNGKFIEQIIREE